MCEAPEVSGEIDVKAVITASRSDVGRTRAENQDACGDFLHLAGARLLVLADGMGGPKGGRVASRMCVDAFARVFQEQQGGSEDQLHAAFSLANDEIHRASNQDDKLSGMGTTGVALLLAHDGSAFIAWIGDSRVYRWRKGTLEQLSQDHSLVAEWVRTGVISAADAQTHPRRSVLTRAIGVGASVEPDIYALDVEPGDRFLLCSDGLSSLVPERDVCEILGDLEPITAAEALVGRANEMGGTDNVSVQIAVLPDDAFTSGRDARTPELASTPAAPPAPAPESARTPREQKRPKGVGRRQPLERALHRAAYAPLHRRVLRQGGGPVLVAGAATLFLMAIGVVTITRDAPGGDGLPPGLPGLGMTPAEPWHQASSANPPQPGECFDSDPRCWTRVQQALPTESVPQPMKEPGLPPAAQPGLPPAAQPLAGPIEQPVPAPPAEVPVVALDVDPALRDFLQSWLRAAWRSDYGQYRGLGFPDPPELFEKTYASWEGFRFESAGVEPGRGDAARLYVRATLSYVFENESGRWRTEDEHRLILRKTDDGLRYDGRWK